MRLIVTADVHLSSDNTERLEALENVVRIAEKEAEKDSAYLLIAGDMFDAEVNVEDVKTDIRDLFSGNNFQTLVIPGNHDEKAFREEDYFGDDIEIVSERPFKHLEFDEINLAAVPFGADSFDDLIPDLQEVRRKDKSNILLLHGTLSTALGRVFGEESRYLPFSPEQLLSTGFEYVFAGHIHSSPKRKVFGEDDCVFACPGSPVSITRKETEKRGVWLFDTDGKDLRTADVDSFHYVRKVLDLCPGEADKKLADLETELSNEDLERATLCVEPYGFIEMDEGSFFQSLTEVVEDAGADDFEIDRGNVESAKTILDSSLYQQFDEKLRAKDDIDRRTVRRIALKAFSEEERG